MSTVGITSAFRGMSTPIGICLTLLLIRECRLLSTVLFRCLSVLVRGALKERDLLIMEVKCSKVGILSLLVSSVSLVLSSSTFTC